MSEINGPKFSVNNLNFNGLQKAQQEVTPEEKIEEEQTKLNDFSDPKAEALGRSMLFKGVDDTSNDLKALLDNPEIADKSDKVFETSYKALQDAGIENPYEEAASFSTTAI